MAKTAYIYGDGGEYEKPGIKYQEGGKKQQSDAATDTHQIHERAHSGGIDDDPTGSGNPVRSRLSASGLSDAPRSSGSAKVDIRPLPTVVKERPTTQIKSY